MATQDATGASSHRPFGRFFSGSGLLPLFWGYAVYDCVCTTVVAVYFSACCIFSIGLSFPFVFSLDVVRLGHKPKFVFSPDVIPCG